MSRSGVSLSLCASEAGFVEARSGIRCFGWHYRLDVPFEDNFAGDRLTCWSASPSANNSNNAWNVNFNNGNANNNNRDNNNRVRLVRGGEW